MGSRVEVIEVVRPTEADTRDSVAGFNPAMVMDNSHEADFKVGVVTHSGVGTLGADVANLCSAKYRCHGADILV